MVAELHSAFSMVLWILFTQITPALVLFAPEWGILSCLGELQPESAQHVRSSNL